MLVSRRISLTSVFDAFHALSYDLGCRLEYGTDLTGNREVECDLGSGREVRVKLKFRGEIRLGRGEAAR